jgi:hypothetical protein
VPSWARKIKSLKDDPRGPCPVTSEALGEKLGAALVRGEELAAAFEEWRLGDGERGPAIGSVDWLVKMFQGHNKYKRLDPATQAYYDDGLKLVQEHRLKSGTKFGTVQVADITPTVADRIYIRLRDRVEGKGEPQGEPRASFASQAIKSIRRAWNACWRDNQAAYPKDNPFMGVELEKSGRKRGFALRDDMLAFVAKADELGYPMVGTAAMISFEWLQREKAILQRLVWSDYQAGIRVKVVHSKTGEVVWMPLADQNGERLFPELEVRLAAATKLGALIVLQERPDKHGNHRPWSISGFQHLAAEIRVAAGLPADITFSTFRHGGFTEAGDVGGTDQELMAAGGHRTRETVSVYTRRTNVQAQNLASKRKLHRLSKRQP